MINRKYAIFGIVFLLLSLTGAVFLVKKEQDTREIATETCSDSVRQSCEQAIPDPLDRCTTLGQKDCHWIGGTLKTVTCTQYSSYCTDCGINAWIITNQLECDLGGAATPTSSGSVGTCQWDGSKYNNIPLGGNCYAVRYHCPTAQMGGALGGCNEHGPAYKEFRTSGDGVVGFDSSQCGMQQIDSSGCGCVPNFQSIYYPCITPTVTTTLITNTPTKTPTPKPPTKTPTPTATSVPNSCGTTCNDGRCNTGLTCIEANGGRGYYCSLPQYVDACRINPGYAGCCSSVSTPTPTPTNGPSSTPTTTSSPSSTPTPTPTGRIVTEGPSPTRIVLPEAGFEFPAQALTIVGGIVTLLGFLILL